MRAVIAAVFLGVFLAAGLALADTPEEQTVPVVAIEQGDPAPFAGLLLTEAAYQVALDARIRVVEQDAMLSGRDEAIARLQAELDAAANAPVPMCKDTWWGNYGWAVGVVGGVVATGLLVWGAVEVLDTRD